MEKIDTIRAVLNRMHALSTSGFAIALHVEYTTPRFLFQTYDKAWVNHYSQRGLVMQDPTVRWGLEHEGAVDWADLAAEDPADVLGQARAHGMAHGVTIAVAAEGTRSLGSFSRGERAFAPDEISDLREMVSTLHGETAGLDRNDIPLDEMLRRLSVELTHA